MTTHNKKPARKGKARILIVDDHPLVRRGLMDLIADEPDLVVCGEAADAVEALRQVDALDPDLVIIDISLKQGHGLELIKRIRTRDKPIKMLVCSMHDEALFAERALRAGAMGYLNKEEATEKVIDAIREVLRGKVYLSADMTERLLGRAVKAGKPLARLSNESLSDRELAVFEMLGQGLTTGAIADKLQLSVKTIETYREHIKSKLDLKNSAELGRHAAQWVLENS